MDYKALLKIKMVSAFMLIIVFLVGCSVQKQALIPEEVQNVKIAESIGKVQFMKPSDPTWINAVSGMGLEKSDTLATDLNSEVELDVDQDKHITVGEEVRMIVLDLLFEAGQNTITKLKVDNGSLYFRINRKLNSDEQFEIKTPTCIMGVRGTHFVVEVKGSDTLISVMEGNVTGKTQNTIDDGTSIDFTVEGGYKILIPENVSTEKDLLMTPLKQSDLPTFVLNNLKQNPDNLPMDYISNIDEAIAAAKDRDGHVVIEESQRLMDPFTGHSYALYDAQSDFYAAQTFCESIGGHLMTISSDAEQALAERLLPSGQKAFYLIGLLQSEGAVEPDEGYHWITGEPVTYTHWHQENGVATEPNNAGAGGKPENFTTLSRAGTWPIGDWNDQNLESIAGNYGFLCEWESEAKSTASVLVNTIKPFDPSLLTYENFIALQLGTPAKDTVAFFGEGTHINNQAEERWLWGNQDQFITITVRETIIKGCTQKGLHKALTKMNLQSIELRGQLLESTTLEKVEALLGTQGSLMSHFMMENGDIIKAYVWYDSNDQKYMATVNETTGTIDHSF